MSTSRILFAALVASLAGCTQVPTEKQNVVDMRPRISFKSSDENALRGKVFVDGLEVGTVGDYLDGKAAVRVLPGNHLVRVQLDGAAIHEEKIYVTEGVNRALIVK